VMPGQVKLRGPSSTRRSPSLPVLQSFRGRRHSARPSTATMPLKPSKRAQCRPRCVLRQLPAESRRSLFIYDGAPQSAVPPKEQAQRGTQQKLGRKIDADRVRRGDFRPHCESVGSQDKTWSGVCLVVLSCRTYQSVRIFVLPRVTQELRSVEGQKGPNSCVNWLTC
jgi:hypothetical protein